MSARLIAALALAATLAACAGGDAIKLFRGENGAETGGVAVLDPETGKDLGVVDQASSRAKINARGAKTKRFDEAALKPAERALMGFLPPPAVSTTLEFVRDSLELTAEAQKLVPDIKADFDARPGAELVIIGHTDSTGDQAYNDDLSLKRAEAVRATLLALLNIPESATSIAGRGERDPLPGHDGDERPDPANRRVEVLVR